MIAVVAFYSQNIERNMSNDARYGIQLRKHVVDVHTAIIALSMSAMCVP